MQRKLYIVLMCFFTAVVAYPQDKFEITVEKKDSLYVLPQEKKVFKPDANKAVWLSAIVPGLGQIYNRQYWKLPIVYGGALGLTYAITWNNQMYVDYRKGYIDLIDSDPHSQAYVHLLPDGVELTSENRSYYERVIKNKVDSYQRFRDLSIICVGVLYLLSIIDAYVDAQLYDYDISPDLSMRITPSVMPINQDVSTDAAIGINCSFNF